MHQENIGLRRGVDYFLLNVRDFCVDRKNLPTAEPLSHSLLEKRLFSRHRRVLHDVHDQVNKYLLGTSRLPLILHGPRGSGKTHLMATVAATVSGCI